MKHIILFSICALILFSCAKNFLKETPYSTVAPENFYKNARDANAAVLGIYQALYFREGLFRQILLPFTESASDLFTGNPTATLNGREFSDYELTVESNNIKQIWAHSYDAINRSNGVIDNLTGNENVSDSVKAQYTAEAKFTRALMYYYLVQLFGDVPLVTSQSKSLEGENVSRTPANEVWAYIINDLNDAISMLPEKSAYSDIDKPRASKGAARMLLSKIYMIQQNWAGALSIINDIINSNQYALEPDITMVFRVATENGQESIFEAQYISGSIPTLGSSFYRYYILSNVFFGFNTFIAVDSKLKTYDTTSARFKAYFTDRGRFVHPVTGVIRSLGNPIRYLYKFYDIYSANAFVRRNFNDDEFNFRIFRYADVLLMKAECENEINGPNQNAVDAINQIRQRAGEILYTLNDVGTKDDFRETIFKERYLELYGEGHRWFDLKRRGTAYFIQKVNEVRPGKNIPEYKALFPIPYSERILNPNLTQNPGWE